MHGRKYKNMNLVHFISQSTIKQADKNNKKVAPMMLIINICYQLRKKDSKKEKNKKVIHEV
jgi:hypothetical protein